MIIANELKKTNIAEYILYMWQIEDLIRAYHFDIKLIKENIISKYQKSNEVKKEIENWYEGLIELMEIDKIKQKGHFKFIISIINDLNELHLKILYDAVDKEYITYYNAAAENIQKLKEKSKKKDISDIEICFNGLYGLLLFRLKKLQVSKETTEALKSISGLINLLSKKFNNNKV